MTLIDRYIVRAVLTFAGLVMAVLLVLAMLFTFMGEQGDVGQGHYTALSALGFVLLNLPQQAWELMPIGVLIGSLLGLGSLARGSELTVMRSSGVSVARLAGAAFIGGLVLLAVEVILGQLAPPIEQSARDQKAFARFSNVSFGGGGAWVRDGNMILNVEQLAGAREFGGMLVFELSPDHRLQAIGHAARATAAPGSRWVLSGYTESRFTPDQVVVHSEGERALSSNVSARFLSLAMAEPRELAVQALWTVIRYYRGNALDPTPYVFALWSRIARTLAIAFAPMLAIPFVLGPLRSAGAGSRTVVGLLLGLTFFFVQRLIETGTAVFKLNPVVLAWLPTLLLLGVTLILLARTRRV